MRMRYGFTTGSCAAAASKAAAYMLLTGKKKETISIVTPKGIVFETKLLDITRKEKSVSCAVEKDGGDDPDITTGALVYAEVSYTERSKTFHTETSLQEEKQPEMQPTIPRRGLNVFSASSTPFGIEIITFKAPL